MNKLDSIKLDIEYEVIHMPDVFRLDALGYSRKYNVDKNGNKWRGAYVEYTLIGGLRMRLWADTYEQLLEKVWDASGKHRNLPNIVLYSRRTDTYSYVKNDIVYKYTYNEHKQEYLTIEREIEAYYQLRSVCPMSGRYIFQSEYKELQEKFEFEGEIYEAQDHNNLPLFKFTFQLFDLRKKSNALLRLRRAGLTITFFECYGGRLEVHGVYSA